MAELDGWELHTSEHIAGIGDALVLLAYGKLPEGAIVGDYFVVLRQGRSDCRLLGSGTCRMQSEDVKRMEESLEQVSGSDHAWSFQWQLLRKAGGELRDAYDQEIQGTGMEKLGQDLNLTRVDNSKIGGLIADERCEKVIEMIRDKTTFPELERKL